MLYILFPSSYINWECVDENFQTEFEAAMENNIPILLFNQKKWDLEKQIEILGDTYDSQKDMILYRGWMMKPEDYLTFYDKLCYKNIKLLTSPKEYQMFHLFPNIYSFIKNDTPPILQFKTHSPINVSLIEKQFGAFIIKDSVKSAKNTKFPTYFTEDTKQEDFDYWMTEFYKIRGSLLTGNIVAKKYENLKKYGEKTNEFRVFYLQGMPISISRNSLQNKLTEEVPNWLIEKYSNLPSPFYTIDYAEKEDGSWIIIEAGDGGVSGTSPEQDLHSFYKAIKIILDKDYLQEKGR